MPSELYTREERRLFGTRLESGFKLMRGEL